MDPPAGRPRLRVLGEAVPAVHPSEVVRRCWRRREGRHRRHRRFREATAPLHEAGKLGAVLAQCPVSFRNAAVAHDHIVWRVAERGAVGLPGRGEAAVPELERRRGRARLLIGLGAAWAQIDEPRFRLSIEQNFLPDIDTFYMHTAHDRNARKYWRHDRAEERYHVGAAVVPGQRGCCGPRRQATLPVREQPLRGEGGGQRGHAEAPVRPGGVRRLSRREDVAPSGSSRVSSGCSRRRRRGYGAPAFRRRDNRTTRTTAMRRGPCDSELAVTALPWGRRSGNTSSRARLVGARPRCRSWPMRWRRTARRAVPGMTQSWRARCRLP